ncbi:MAG: hypothetical protein JWQ32_2509 [Marmoricola sp.]|nr:hypothetical protein [Marmoricola sp.]
MIPAEFTGGWARQGIGIDGRPPVEDAVVWWLQAPVRHADLRVPVSGTGPSTSFAGVTSWDGSALTWSRQVDLEHFDGTDVGTTTWDGEDLLESGTFSEPDGSTTDYVERWTRLPGSAAPLWALRRGAARLVRAGDYAITLADERVGGGVFTATAWSRSGNGWQVHHTLPGVPLAPAPPSPEGTDDSWAAE